MERSLLASMFRVASVRAGAGFAFVLAAALALAGVVAAAAPAALLVEQGKLVGTSSSRLGTSIALSADGDTAIVGAPDAGQTAKASGAGEALVYVREHGQWLQQAQITGPLAEHELGLHVAISANGETALIAGRKYAAFYARSGSTWVEQGAAITEPGAALFASSVALSGDGATALIGGGTGEGGIGEVWVYVRSGESWSRQGPVLELPAETSFSQGAAAGVGLSSDGDVGAALNGEQVVPLSRSGEAWSVGAPLLTSAVAETLAVSADGTTAVAGLRGFSGGGGTLHDLFAVFTHSGTEWSRQAEVLTPGREQGVDRVAVSGDGNTVLVGVTGIEEGTAAVELFTRSEGVWTEGQSLRPIDLGVSEIYGQGLALSEEGTTAMVGAPAVFEENTLREGGEVWGFGVGEGVAAPEIGRCVRVDYTLGTFGDKGCTSLKRYGAYDLAPVGQPAGFTIAKLSTSPVMELHSVGGKVIDCTGLGGGGEYVGRRGLTNVVLKLTGCSWVGFATCASAGAATGEVVTEPLGGTLGIEKTGTTPILDTPGIDLFPAGRVGAFANFTCGTRSVTVRGGVIGVAKGNKAAGVQDLSFAASKGKQRPESFVGGPREVLEASLGLGGAYEQTGLIGKASLTGEQPVEYDMAF